MLCQVVNYYFRYWGTVKSNNINNPKSLGNFIYKHSNNIKSAKQSPHTAQLPEIISPGNYYSVPTQKTESGPPPKKKNVLR